MSNQPPRVVYDCNVYLQAIMNPRGPAGSCVRRALEGQVVTFVSDLLLAEVRDMQNRPALASMGVTGVRKRSSRTFSKSPRFYRTSPRRSNTSATRTTRITSISPSPSMRG